MRTPHPATFISRLTTLLVTAAAFAACSSASDPESTEQGSQALDCTTGDITHPCVIPPPTPTPKEPVCVSNPHCSEFPKGTPGFDPASITTYPNGSDPFQGPLPVCTVDTALPAQLAAIGCTPEMIYVPGGIPDSGILLAIDTILWGTSFCPEVLPSVAEVPCDSCTGAPPAGWHTVTWPLSCATGAQPGGGCASLSCRLPP